MFFIIFWLFSTVRSYIDSREVKESATPAMEASPAKQAKVDDDPSPSSAPPLFLVWLDSSIETSEENVAVQAQLRTLTLNLRLYRNETDCEDYIKSQSNQSQIVLITNGGLGSVLVPRVNDLEQIIAIYVFCADRERHRKWADGCSKVRLVTTQFAELRTAIHGNHFNETLPIIEEPLDENDNAGTGIYELNNQHMIADVSLHYLSQMKRTSDDKADFVLLCQKEVGQNSNRRAVLQQFQEDNSSDRILTWFNRDQMFNEVLLKAFQCLNIEAMYHCRYFVQEIQKYFDQHQHPAPVEVYRGTTMSNELLRDLKSCEGKIIGIKSPLTTTFDHGMAVFCSDDQSTEKPVLLEINADPQVKGVKPFVKISPGHDQGLKDGVVFMIGSLFRIDGIREDENDVTIFKMTLCADEWIESVKENLTKSGEDKDFIGFIQLLYGLSSSLTYPNILSNADKLLAKYLNNSLANDADRVRGYELLANVLFLQNQFDSSLIYYEKAVELKQKSLPANDPSFIDIYYHIACIYSTKQENHKALELYKQILTTSKQTYGEDYFPLIGSYASMCVIYEREGDYKEALLCYNQMFAIMLKHFPIDHENFAPIFNNMGKTFSSLGQHFLALGYYQTALEIRLKHHLSKEYIAGNYKTIGFVYKQLGNLEQARQNFELAASTYSELYSSTHETVLEIQQLIGNLST